MKYVCWIQAINMFWFQKIHTAMSDENGTLSKLALLKWGHLSGDKIL